MNFQLNNIQSKNVLIYFELLWAPVQPIRQVICKKHNYSSYLNHTLLTLKTRLPNCNPFQVETIFTGQVVLNVLPFCKT